MGVINLTKGMVAVVDDADLEWLSNYKWVASYHGRNGRDKWYAVCSSPRLKGKNPSNVRMHRLIMGVHRGDKRVVHHKDDDSLNNTRSNLEIVANNAANMAKCRNWKNFGG